MPRAIAANRRTKPQAETRRAAPRPAPVAVAPQPAAVAPETPPEIAFNYAVEAELFPTRNRKSNRVAFGYRRFARASEAIRFAVEQLPSDALAGAYLEVHEKRFDRNGILRLYESDAYPLPRRAANG